MKTKRLLSAFVAGVITTTVFTGAMSNIIPSITANAADVLGDANGDGKCDIRDAAYIAKAISTGKASALPLTADYNKNGKVDIRDAAAIAMKLSGGKMSSPTSPFKDFAGKYSYSAGVSGSHTSFTLKADGSFEGECSDSFWTEKTSSYPNGTVYICSFKGRFTEPQKVNSYTYKMTLSNIALKKNRGYEEIKNGIRYVYTASAPGFNEVKNMYIYTKGAPISNLPPMWGISGSKLSNTVIYNEVEKANFVKAK